MQKFFGAAFGLLLSGVAAQAGTIYSTNFDGALGSEWGGVTTQVDVGGYANYGFAGQFLQNTSTGNPASASTLTLSGLGARATLDFDLATIDSWDGSRDTGDAGIDWFNVAVNGVTVFSLSAAQAYTFGDEVFPAGTTDLVAMDDDFFGIWWQDGAFHVTLDLAGLSPTSTISFFSSGSGWQGGSDESWAIDNLTVAAVPLPATAPLVLMGLAGMAALRRRAKKA